MNSSAIKLDVWEIPSFIVFRNRKKTQEHKGANRIKFDLFIEGILNA
jgi:hypothetical protein